MANVVEMMQRYHRKYNIDWKQLPWFYKNGGNSNARTHGDECAPYYVKGERDDDQFHFTDTMLRRQLSKALMVYAKHSFMNLAKVVSDTDLNDIDTQYGSWRKGSGGVHIVNAEGKEMFLREREQERYADVLEPGTFIV